MPEYLVTDPQSGRKVKLTGDSPPTEHELEEIFGSFVPKDDRNILARTLNPRRENLPESIPALRNQSPEDALNLARGGQDQYGLRLRNPDPNAQITQDEYGNPLINMNGQPAYMNRPGLSGADIAPAFKAVDSAAKEVAPYLAAGAGAVPITLGRGLLAQGGTGLAAEAINQTGNAIQGEEVNWGKLATTPLFAMAGEAAGRAAYAVARPVISTLLGNKTPDTLVNPDGTLTEETIKALADNGVSPERFDDLATRELTRLRDAGQITAEQAERFNFFKGLGIEPTRAQVTRSADDFMLQQEAAKTGTAVRETLEGQEAQIAEAFDTTLRGTGGNGVTSNSPVADAVLNKAVVLDQEISRLYGEARKAAPEEKFVRLNRYAQNLRSRASDNEITGGLIKSLKGDLVERGILDKNWKVVGKIDVNTAEKVRQVINERYDSTNDLGRIIMRGLKDSLDDDVLSAAGDDLFKAARKAKAQFEAGLTTGKLSKFDKNQRSLVREVLENKIKSDDLFDRAILGKTWKAKDLDELRTYLTNGSPEQITAGTQAWNDLRAETVQWIKDQTFANALDQSGNATMRSGAIKRALDKIGQERIGVLFTGPEQQFLKAMRRLEQLRQPVPMTGGGKGPSAQAIAGMESEVKKLANKVPMLGSMLEILQNSAKSAAATGNPVQKAIDKASSARSNRGATGLGAGSGVMIGDKTTWGT